MKIYYPIIKFKELKRPKRSDFKRKPKWKNYYLFLIKSFNNNYKILLLIPIAFIIFIYNKIEWWIAKNE